MQVLPQNDPHILGSSYTINAQPYAQLRQLRREWQTPCFGGQQLGSQWHHNVSCWAKQTLGKHMCWWGMCEFGASLSIYCSHTQLTVCLSMSLGKAELHLRRNVTYFASELPKNDNCGNIALKSMLLFTVTDRDFPPGGNNFAKKFDV